MLAVLGLAAEAPPNMDDADEGVGAENGLCSLFAEPKMFAFGLGDSPRPKLPKPSVEPVPPNMFPDDWTVVVAGTLPKTEVALVEPAADVGEMASDPNIDPALDCGDVAGFTSADPPKMEIGFGASAAGVDIAELPKIDGAVVAGSGTGDPVLPKIEDGVAVGEAKAFAEKMLVPVGTPVFALHTFKSLKRDPALEGAVVPATELCGAELLGVDNPDNEKLRGEIPAVVDVIGVGTGVMDTDFVSSVEAVVAAGAAETDEDMELIAAEGAGDALPLNKLTTVGDDSAIVFGALGVEAFAKRLLAFADSPKEVSGAGAFAACGLASALAGTLAAGDSFCVCPNGCLGFSASCGVGLGSAFSF